MVFHPPSYYSHHRILIVDDYPDSARSTCLVVRAIGCRAQYALDAQEAIRVGTLFEPTLILLDLGMRGVDGIEACRRMRQLAWGREARIVAYTGWGPEQVFQAAMDAGFDGYLLKPLDRNKLMDVLNDCDVIPIPPVIRLLNERTIDPPSQHLTPGSG